MSGTRLTTAAGLMVLLAGCQGGAPVAAAPVEARSVSASQMCRLVSQRQDAFLINDQAQWEQLGKGLPSTQVGGGEAQPPPVDFERERLLVVSMGQRTSGGYAISFTSATVRPDQVLEVVVDWREPARGAMSAAVMTLPCMVVAVPVAGYQKIEVVDQQGRQRLSLPVKP